MPDLGPLGRGGARRRTRRRMTLVNEMQNASEAQQQKELEEPEELEKTENIEVSASSDKLEKLAKLLRDKGVITESEYNLLFD